MFKPGVKTTQITRLWEGEKLSQGERHEGLCVDGKFGRGGNGDEGSDAK